MLKGNLVTMLVVAMLSSVTTVGVVRITSPAPKLARAGGGETLPVVRAQRFELVDPAGAARGRLAFLPDGRPLIALFDEAGQVRIQMTQNPEREYSFSIADAQGTQRFGVGTTARGFVGLNVRDGAGRIRSNLYATDDGSDTGFQAFDERQPRIKLGALSDPGEFGVRVVDADDRVIWQAP